MSGRFWGISESQVKDFISAHQLDTVTTTRPPLAALKPAAKPIHAVVRSHMREYAELAKTVGVKVPDLGIEGFTAFLEQHNITVFSLVEVIKYMDRKAEQESLDKVGWEWRPLRDKDNRKDFRFGTEPVRRHIDWNNGKRVYETRSVGSDYYRGPTEEKDSKGTAFLTEASSLPYEKHIPLHALRKVALIEKEYGGDVAFFVSDYAVATHIAYPDPFLMAVVPNLDVNKGAGRFVIDFWDEPGFGLDKQLLAP